MADKQVNNSIQINKGKHKLGSGSKYHEEHSSNVPDYGANIIDPNATGVSNVEDNNTH